jgi:peptide/nickel transport system substrate-binding protein
MPIRRVLVAALAAAVLGSQPATAQSVLRTVPHADLVSIDPMAAPAQILRIYAYMVYDTLFALDGKLAPRPMMLEGYTVSADRLTYTFTLRPGLVFHDGQQVTTRDVVPSLNRWFGTHAAANRMQRAVAGIDRIDDRTFVMRLKEPFGLVEYALAAATPITPAILREKDAVVDVRTRLTEAVGSGPFRFIASEWRSGHQAVFEPFKDYRIRPEPPDGLAGGRKVKVDRVEWRIIPQPNTVAAALVSGEVDFWDTASLDLVPTLEKNPSIVVRRTVLLQSQAAIRPNFLHPPFNDVRARQALALLFDQKEFMSSFAGEPSRWSTCRSFSVCGSNLGIEEGSEAFRQTNLERAKALLKEAGYNGERVVVLSTPQLLPMYAMAQVAAQRLREAGVNVDLQLLDTAVYFQRNNSKAPVESGGWHLYPGYGLGATFFHPLTNPMVDTTCDGRNFSGWPCDETATRLRDAFLVAGNDQERAEANRRFQERLWQFLPYIPVGQFDQVNAYRRNLEGVLDSNLIAYWNIEKR